MLCSRLDRASAYKIIAEALIADPPFYGNGRTDFDFPRSRAGKLFKVLNQI